MAHGGNTGWTPPGHTPPPWPPAAPVQFGQAFGRVLCGPRHHPPKRRTVRGSAVALGLGLLWAVPAVSGTSPSAVVPAAVETVTRMVTVTVPAGPVETVTVVVTAPPLTTHAAATRSPAPAAAHTPARTTTAPRSVPRPVPHPSATARPKPPAAVYYPNCAAVRAAGAAPLYRGEPGYRPGLDRDGDGVACE